MRNTKTEYESKPSKYEYEHTGTYIFNHFMH